MRGKSVAVVGCRRLLPSLPPAFGSALIAFYPPSLLRCATVKIVRKFQNSAWRARPGPTASVPCGLIAKNAAPSRWSIRTRRHTCLTPVSTSPKPASFRHSGTATPSPFDWTSANHLRHSTASINRQENVYALSIVLCHQPQVSLTSPSSSWRQLLPIDCRLHPH